MKIVLASASPRRKRLLRRILPSRARQETGGEAFRICKRFSVRVARIDERIHAGESFAHACVRLAEMKAREVEDGKCIVIGADTVAYLGKKNFRKTKNKAAARRVLSFLGGKTHYVITGVCVLFPDGKCVRYAVKTAVRMKKFSDRQLASYLRSGEWKGRAGCYDVSGKGRKLVASVRGEEETVVGLPLKKLKGVLSSA